MAFYPRTSNQSESLIRIEHLSGPERMLPCVNTWEISNTVPSKQKYQHLRAPRFSASKLYRESRDWYAGAQDEYRVMANLTNSRPHFVGNFNHPQPPSISSSQVAPTRPAAVAPVRREEILTFVGNFTHPPNITQDQLITLLNSAKTPNYGCVANHGVPSTMKGIPKPSLPGSSSSGMVKHTHPSMTVSVRTPAQVQELQSASAFDEEDTEDLIYMGTTYSSPMSSAEGVESLQQQANYDLIYMGTTYSHPMSPSAESVAPLKNVANFIPESSDTAALLRDVGPLKFVGNFTLPAEVLPGHQCKTLKPVQRSVSASMAQEGATGQRINPPQSKSSTTHYTREQFMQMMEYHRYMASCYRGIKLRADHTPKVEGAVCSKELQRKRGVTYGSNSDEPPQKRSCDDGTEDIVLPQDAVEKLSVMRSVWDLSEEMGFLTVSEAADCKSLYCDNKI
ncbi:hypothetical protein ACEWY4_019102 [Coilia grayii]|uniref:Uncharacterized protein n=1 Tax=Coilia grayii TaxID=363190 RepID=A0ABD1JFG4_9TELE